jgi:hypothetical protein
MMKISRCRHGDLSSIRQRCLAISIAHVRSILHPVHHLP